MTKSAHTQNFLHSLGYSSVSEALSALKADPIANVSVQDGWTIISTEENGNHVLWSFTPKTHPAHPAAVKRELIERDGAFYISMTALCQADKLECDALIQQFEELNNQMRRAITGGT